MLSIVFLALVFGAVATYGGQVCAILFTHVWLYLKRRAAGLDGGYFCFRPDDIVLACLGWFGSVVLYQGCSGRQAAGCLSKQLTLNQPSFTPARTVRRSIVNALACFTLIWEFLQFVSQEVVVRVI